MLEHTKIAISAVLTYNDKHLEERTTCARRLKCLDKIHKQLPPRVRGTIKDFNHLHTALRRVLQDVNNLRVSDNGHDNEDDMRRLFAEGSKLFAQDFLDTIQYGLVPSTEDNVSEDHDQERNAQCNRKKRKATPDISGSDHSPAAKFPRRGVESGLDRGAGGQQGFEYSPNTKLSAGHLLGIIDDAGGEFEEAFANIDQLVEEVSAHVFDDQQGSRMAQLTPKPIPELERLYVHAFGDESWKVWAIELQSANTLSAREFLPCIVWSFLIVNVFDETALHGYGRAFLRDVAYISFLKTAIEAAGANYDETVQDATMRQLEDPVFHDTVIVPKSNTLSHKLMLVLEAHLSRLPGKHATRQLTQLARDICRASLLLRERLKVVWKTYHIEWYTTGDAFDRTSMDRLPGNSDSTVAFTSKPGMSRQLPGRGLVWKVRVKTTATITPES